MHNERIKALIKTQLREDYKNEEFLRARICSFEYCLCFICFLYVHMQNLPLVFKRTLAPALASACTKSANFPQNYIHVMAYDGISYWYTRPICKIHTIAAQ